MLSTKLKALSVTVFAVWLAASAVVLATTPQKINYQGYLRQNNIPVDSGGVNIEFRLYDDPSAGAQLCTSGVQSIAVTLGRFNYVLGTNTCDLSTIDWHATEVYLQIIVDGNPMLPREQVVSGVYSLGVDGTQEEAFIIDIDNTGAAGAASMTVRFERGTDGPDAVFGWSEPNDRFVLFQEGANFADVWMGVASATFFYGDGSNITNITAAGAVDNTGDEMSGPLTVSIVDGTAVYASSTGGNSATATLAVKSDNADSNSMALEAIHTGSGAAITGRSYGASGGGPAAFFTAPNAAHDTNLIGGDYGGTGKLMNFSTGGSPALVVDNAGNIFASGTASATYFIGDGSLLTNISAAGAVDKTGDSMSGPLSIIYDSAPGDPALEAVSLAGTGHAAYFQNDTATAVVRAVNLSAGANAVGLAGDSQNSYGVVGASDGDAGVYGYSNNYAGVVGDSTNGFGGIFENLNGGNTSASLYALSVAATSTIYGLNTSGNANSYGVYGRAQGDGAGVYGRNDDGPGVKGYSMNGPGVYGEGLNDRAAFFYTNMNSNATDVLYVESWSGQMGSSVIGANHNGSDGMLLNLRKGGQPTFVVGFSGDLFSSGSVELDSYASATTYYGDGSNLKNLPVAAGAVAKAGDTMTGRLNVVIGDGTAIFASSTGGSSATYVVYVRTDNSGPDAVGLIVESFHEDSIPIVGYSHSGADAVMALGDGVGAAISPRNVGGGDLIDSYNPSGKAFVVDNAGNVFASGTSSATYFIGNGSLLTGISGADISRVLKTGDTMTGPLNINYNSATASLAVENTGAGFAILASGTVQVGRNSGADGYDVNFYGTFGGAADGRMFWDADKNAFRTGLDENGMSWNDPNVGEYSFGAGRNSRASGLSSIVMGNTSIASGDNSTAIGYTANAGGSSSTAIGTGVLSSGAYSTSLGLYTTAAGAYSFSAGRYVTAGVAANTIVFGNGFDNTNRLVNNTADSLMIGFNTTVPTLFVGPSSGIGSFGSVSIGSATPTATFDVRGDVRVALGNGDPVVLITQAGDIAASASLGFDGPLYVAGDPGSGGEVLISNGGGSNPTWQPAPAGGVDKNGDLMIGALTVDINSGTAIFASSTGDSIATATLRVMTDNSDSDSVAIHAEHIGAGKLLTMDNAAGPAFQVSNTGDVFASGTAEITGNTYVGKLYSGSSMYINYDGPDENSALYFFDGGDPQNESLYWDETEGRFQLSNQLFITANAAGDILNINNSSGAGGGAAGHFELTDSGSDAAALIAVTNGTTGTSYGVLGAAMGDGAAFFATQATPGGALYAGEHIGGGGKLIALENGGGPAFVVDDGGIVFASGTFVSSVDSAGQTAFYYDGSNADGIYVDNPGNDGKPAQFITSSGGNDNAVLTVEHQGTGMGAVISTAGATDTLRVIQNGDAPAIRGRHTFGSGKIMRLESGVGPYTPKFVVDYDGNIFASGSINASGGGNYVDINGDVMTGKLEIVESATKSLYVSQTGNSDVAGYFELESNSSTKPALHVKTNSSNINAPALLAEADGNSAYAVKGMNLSGTGAGVYGYSNDGYGVYAHSQTMNGTALYALNNLGGTSLHSISTIGYAGIFEVAISGNATDAVHIKSISTQPDSTLIGGEHTGSNGKLIVMRSNPGPNPKFVVDYDGNVFASGSINASGGGNYVDVNGDVMTGSLGVVDGSGATSALSVYQQSTLKPAAYISTENFNNNDPVVYVNTDGDGNLVVMADTLSPRFVVDNDGNIFASGSIQLDAGGIVDSKGDVMTGSLGVVDGSGATSALSAYQQSTLKPAAYITTENSSNDDPVMFVNTDGGGHMVLMTNTLSPRFVVDNDGNIFASGSIQLDAGGIVDSKGDVMTGSLGVVDGSGATSALSVYQQSTLKPAAYISTENFNNNDPVMFVNTDGDGNLVVMADTLSPRFVVDNDGNIFASGSIQLDAGGIVDSKGDVMTGSLGVVDGSGATSALSVYQQSTLKPAAYITTENVNNNDPVMFVNTDGDGHLALMTNTLSPRFVVDNDGNVSATGAVVFGGPFAPSGDPGANGEILISGGPGVSPTWQPGGGNSVAKTGDVMSGKLGIAQNAATASISIYHTGGAGTGYAGYFKNTNGANTLSTVYADSAAATATIFANNTEGSATSYGVYGRSSNNGVGVMGYNPSGGVGVYGQGQNSKGVYGLSVFGAGLYGDSQDGQGVYAAVSGTSGKAAIFENTDVNNPNTPLEVNTAGLGNLLDLQNDGTSRFVVDNTGNVFASGGVNILSSSKELIFGDHNGASEIVRLEQSAQPMFVIDNSGNVFASGSINMGSGGFVELIGGVMSGALGIDQNTATASLYVWQTNNTDEAGYFKIQNMASAADAMYVTTTGSGRAGNFEITDGGNVSTALLGKTAGSGAAVTGLNNGIGRGGYFWVNNGSSSGDSVFAENSGNGDLYGGNHTGPGKLLSLGTSGSSMLVVDNGGNVFASGSINTQAVGSTMFRGDHGGPGLLMRLEETGQPQFVIDNSGNIFASGSISLGGGGFVSSGGDVMSGGLEIHQSATKSLFVTHTGTTDQAAYIQITEPTSAKIALEVINSGTNLTSHGIRVESRSASYAVIGDNKGAGGAGVYGINDSTGVGVWGGNTGSGYGVLGTTNGTGPALAGNHSGGSGNIMALQSGGGSRMYVNKDGDLWATGSINSMAVGKTMYWGDHGGGGLLMRLEETGSPQFVVDNSGNIFASGSLNVGAAPFVALNGDVMAGALGIDQNTATASLYVWQTNNTDEAGYFKIQNMASTADALYVTTTGNGRAGNFEITSGLNAATALLGKTAGSGAAVTGLANGTGRGGYFWVNNGTSSSDSVFAQHSGAGDLFGGNHTGSGKLISLGAGGNTKFAVENSGNMFASGTVSSESNFYIGNGSTFDNDFLYFDVGAESLSWNNGTNYFEFTNNMKAPTVVADNNMYVNYDGDGGGGDSDSYLYFFDGGGVAGQSIKWEDAQTRFRLSAPMVIGVDAASYVMTVSNLNAGGGTAGYFSSTSGTGLQALTSGTGAGNYGVSGDAGGAGKGVFGSNDGSGAGVWGTNTGSGYGIYAQNSNTDGIGLYAINNSGGTSLKSESTTGHAAWLASVNAGSATDAVLITTNSTTPGGVGLHVKHTGSGDAAGVFEIDNTGSGQNTLVATTNGDGNALVVAMTGDTAPASYFYVDNGLNSQPALYGLIVNGTGQAVWGESGSANASSYGVFGKQTNGADAVKGYSTGVGAGGYFEIDNGGNSNSALYAQTNGTGPPIRGNTTNTGNLIELQQSAGNKFIVANTGFVAQQGCPSPVGVAAGDWVDVGRYCIKNTMYGLQDFLQATASCYGLAQKADVCSLGEVVEACRQNTISTLTTATNIMVDSLSGNNGGVGVGVIQTSAIPCTNISITPNWQNFNTTARYFCCITK